MKYKKLAIPLIALIVSVFLGCFNASAATIGEIFETEISIGGKDVSCTFKVTSENTVQIGDGVNPAIDTSISGDVIIPDKVQYDNTDFFITSIGDVAFTETAITSTGLASNATVTHVGSSAYAKALGLKDTGLGSNTTVMTLGNAVFFGCTNLEKTGFDTNKSISVIPNSAFATCTSLTETGLSTNSTVIDILNSAFLSCTSLESTGIGSHSSIMTIGKSAFSETAITGTGLGENNSVSSIGDRAFEMCENLTDTGLSTNTSVTVIGKFAFWYNINLKDTGLHINSPVVQLGAGAFYGCSSLSEYVELPKTLTSPVFFESYAPTSSQYDVFAESSVKHILYTNEDLDTIDTVSDEWRNTFWQQDVMFERANAYYLSDSKNADIFENSGNFSTFYTVEVTGGVATLNDIKTAEERKGTGFDGKFIVGDLVQISATIPQGMMFKLWESSDVTISQTNSSLSTFTMPQKNVSLTATFQEIPNTPTYEITVTQSEGITITPSTITVLQGATQSFTIAAHKGYTVDKIMVNSAEVNGLTANSDNTYTYTFSDISANQSISAVAKVIDDSTEEGSPSTGDTSFVLWYGLIAFASAVLVFELFRRKKISSNNKNHKA